jgi:5-methylcytosine-specific restriction endonuclease McrA
MAFMERGATLPLVKGQCRVCPKPLPRRLSKRGNGITVFARRNYCSDQCRDLYYMATSSQFVRFKVYERDHGVCVGGCGVDCDDLERRVYGHSQMLRLPRAGSHRRALLLPSNQRTANAEALNKEGFSVTALPRTLWEADHIEPLADGGGFGMENLQTLCQACHREKTYDEAHWRAKRRKLIGKKQTATKRWFKKVRA